MPQMEVNLIVTLLVVLYIFPQHPHSTPKILIGTGYFCSRKHSSHAVWSSLIHWIMDIHFPCQKERQSYSSYLNMPARTRRERKISLHLSILIVGSTKCALKLKYMEAVALICFVFHQTERQASKQINASENISTL